ncbi:hypothetical protein ACJMK2_035672, partial [Sinanodonta woodiana]
NPSDVTYSLSSSFIVSQYFAINSATGEIYVKAPLTRDTSSSNRQYTMSVSVTDKGTPPLSSQQLATVTITVRRNNAAPVFVNTPYDTQISQNVAPIVTTVQTVSATDTDTDGFNVISYAIRGDETASSLFVVDSIGRITLTQSVANRPETFYT